MSIVMGLKVGARGAVRSFEPHPEMFAKLKDNTSRLNNLLGASVIRAESESTLSIECIALDDNILASFSSSLIKLDVEAHELAALQGGAGLIARSVRDIIFEDFGI